MRIEGGKFDLASICWVVWQRKIIWFNPPYSRNVQSNVGKAFLGLITRHFPASHKYHKIFNKNTVKVSYSCMDNMERIIKKHNQKILNANQTTTTHGCNCRKKATCPLKNNCLTPSTVYNAKVTTTEDPIRKNYIGLTEGPFKQRYTQHAHKRSELVSKCRHENKFYLMNLKADHT